jgi:hypothetical protein
MRSAAQDLPALAARLVAQPGGLLDEGGVISAAGRASLEQLIAERARTGAKLWVLVLENCPLGSGLDALAGRLAPGERDIVMMANSGGVLARVPALAGSPALIDEAFEASRRELTADLGAGLVAFARRLDDARARRERDTRAVLMGLGCVGGFALLILLVRWGRFRVQQARWERDASGEHARAVGACQERLHRLASLGAVLEPGLYDRLYAELKELSARPPAEATPGLLSLARRLDAALEPEVKR